ncbi:MAG: hypothetical protein OSB18_06185 [SAR324 cluster bacterium]|nr:hypothetical protein [SAR324 cluster bacterium]|tara:strand:- start:368 stop:748 length:381 start_codon:yes stop_codon:yes gene_type:complete
MRFRFNFLLVMIALWMGCSNPDPEFPISSFISRLTNGDQQMGWGLTYFESWRRSRQPRYLTLAETNTVDAIHAFAALESDTSPRINEYYVVRERRIRGCRLLAELQFEAINNGFSLRTAPPQGCTY